MTSASSLDAAGRSLDAATVRRGMGVVGLVLAFLAPVVGLVVSVVTLVWARRSGERAGPAVWGIVVAVVLIVATVVVGFLLFTQLVGAANDGLLDVQSLCVHRDRWGWLIDSLRYACR